MIQPPIDAFFDLVGVENSMTYVDGAPLKGVLLGYFGPGCTVPACAKYVFVQNLDYTASKIYRVTGPGLLSLFNVPTRSWMPTGHSHVDVTLAPGSGALVGSNSAA